MTNLVPPGVPFFFPSHVDEHHLRWAVQQIGLEGLVHEVEFAKVVVGPETWPPER